MPTTSEETSALAGTTVIVHPLVLLSVTDHASRVAAGARKRVVGVLLGQDRGKTINVANSFAVPFEEDERDGKTWFLDHDYIESMMEMFKKVNAREKMVGWYHTGPKLHSSDLEINELMKRFTPRPVMVIIDPRQQDVGTPTDAYMAVEEIKDDGTATQKTFIHVPTTIEAEESEEVGVEHLLRDIHDTTAVGSLSARISAQLGSLRGLHKRLLEIREYLEAVVRGELPVNHEILYELQNIFNFLPDLEKPEVVRSFRVANNDRLLIVYLSSLIRAVLALHALVNNRLEMARGEHPAQSAAKEEKKGLSIA
ncbi:Rpn8p [Malassezia vespertilionis]|uniref:Rpn8p n=1 Tax=Malassezia vespertilionis TaxID=2020962 RepID=A0A2N1JCS2_9BASI|nr:Rpn8p [Malassezia vespertilionis]